MIKPLIPVINWSDPLTKGLIFDMPFFERGGSLSNELVQKLTGTFVNAPTWVTGSPGAGVNFNGAASSGPAIYYTPKSIQRALSIFSIETLVYQRAGNGGGGAGTILRPTDNTNSAWRIGQEVNGFRFSPRFSTTSGVFDSATVYGGNVIYHKVLNYNGSSSSNVPEMYVNGVPTIVTTTTGPSGTFDTSSDSQWVIGNINQTGNVGNRTFDGHIYVLRIRNRFLNAQEVKKLYENPWRIYTRPNIFQSLSSTVIYAAQRMMMGMGF